MNSTAPNAQIAQIEPEIAQPPDQADQPLAENGNDSAASMASLLAWQAIMNRPRLCDILHLFTIKQAQSRIRLLYRVHAAGLLTWQRDPRTDLWQIAFAVQPGISDLPVTISLIEFCVSVYPALHGRLLGR